MKALFRTTLLACLGLLFAADLAAQCTNTEQFPSGSFAINTSGGVTTISTCSYAGEYSVVTGAVNGQTLNFTYSLPGGYITVRSGSSGGPVVAAGNSPLSFANTFTGTLYAHWNTSSACGSNSTCSVTTVQCTSCGGPVGCNNTNLFGSATINTSGTSVQISGCSWAGEYSTISGAVAGQTLRFTYSLPGGYITVRSGSLGGPVVAAGNSPLTFANTFTGTLYAHWNTSSACGSNSTCSTTTVQCTSCTGPPPPPVGPANDACANATPIACGGTATGSTTTATIDGPGSDCFGGSVAPDVWYTITGTGSNITASLCGSSYDTQLDVYTGSCGALTNIGGCNDDFCGLQSQMTWASILGVVYRIRVHGFSGSTGAFTLAVTCAAPPSGPANDACANATPIACGGTATGSTTTATIDGPGNSCTGGSVAPDVWYTITGTGSNITASLCGSAYDTKLDVYTGSCGALANIGGCNDDFCSLQSQMTWASTLGVVYRIRVHGFSGSTGAFTLAVTCAAPPVPPCNAPGTPSASSITTSSATLSWAAAGGATSYRYSFGTAGHVCGTGSTTTNGTSASLNNLSPNTTYTFCVRTDACGGGSASSYVSTTFTTAPLANDACAGAITVTCGSTINGSTVGAASDAGVGSCSIGTGGTPGNGVWYRLVGNGAQVTASLCASAYDTKLHVYTGSCAGLTCVVSNDDSPTCGTTRSQVIFNASVGTDYYILVSGFSTNTGAFSLNLTCLCGPTLGAPWTTTNIGASNGGAINNVCDGTIDVRATNYGSPTNDIQTYAWQQLCGNGFIKAKVEDVTNGGWGGIMFRETNMGGSRKVALRTQLTSTVIRDLRAATNGFAQSQQFPRPNTPQWLRLTRNGHVFLGETSVDGVNWSFTFSVTLVLPSCIEVGLFAQSINVNTTTTAVFSNVMGVPLTPPVIQLVGGNAPELNVAELDFSLFPNPAQSEINVKMGEEFIGKDVTIRISNQLGQMVLTRRLGEVQNQVENIQLNNLPDGMYIMTLQTEGSHSLTKKFIVGLNRP